MLFIDYFDLVHGFCLLLTLLCSQLTVSQYLVTWSLVIVLPDDYRRIVSV